jgi:hypothetical protein
MWRRPTLAAAAAAARPPCCCRAHSTLQPPPAPPPAPPPPLLPTATGDGTTNALNHSFNRYPALTGMLWLWHSPLSTLGYMGALYASQAPLPPELAPAFVLHAALRRLRLPLTLASAALLARARPALCTVPVARLLLAPLLAVQALQSPPAHVRAGRLRARARAGAAALWAGATRLDELVGGSSTLNRYGLAYIFAGRLTGTLSLVGLTLALRYGVDVEAALRGLGHYLDSINLGRLAWVLSLLPEDHAGGGGSSGLSGSSSGSGGGSSSALAGARGVAATAKDFTIHWAASALLVNVSYPLVLRFGVAGVAGGVGQWLGASPQWQVVIEAVREGQRVAEAEARAAAAAAAAEGGAEAGGGGSAGSADSSSSADSGGNDSSSSGSSSGSSLDGVCSRGVQGVVFRLALFDTALREGGSGVPPVQPPPQQHWISRFYVVKDHCC